VVIFLDFFVCFPDAHVFLTETVAKLPRNLLEEGQRRPKEVQQVSQELNETVSQELTAATYKG